MLWKYGIRYISTLNDIELLRLLIDTGSISEEQKKSLTRTYKSIGQERLKDEVQPQKELKALIEEQIKETKIAFESPRKKEYDER